MVKVLAADAHPVVREGLKRILDEGGLSVAAEAASGGEVLEMAARGEFDVVVLDLRLPGQGGLELIGRLKRRVPAVSILVLSAFPEEQYAVRALREGADGYLCKERPWEYIREAVRKVASGGKYITDTVAERLAAGLNADSRKPPHESLSNREFQVLCRMSSGETVTEIAHDLDLSAKTVSTYRSRILDKLGMSSNAELVRYAVRHRLVD